MFRIVTIFIFLVIPFIGFSQPEASSSSNNLASNIKLIEDNEIERAEKLIRKHINDQNSIEEKANYCHKIAIAYNNNLYYNLSLEYAFEGLSYLGESLYLVAELNHVVIINHIDLKNYDLAESYYWKTVGLNSQKEHVRANEFNLIGEINRLKRHFEKSISFYHEAIKINTQISDSASLAMNYNNIGLSHLSLNHIDSASFYLNYSSQIIQNLQLENRESAINISFGELYLKTKGYAKALAFFKKTMSFELSKHPDKFEVYRDAYNGMKICYELMEDYKNALKSYIKYEEYNTKIFDYKQNTLLLQKQILSERDRHSKELELINSKLQLEIKYKRITLIVLIAILLIIVLIIYILRLRNKRVKEKVELEIKRNRIQELEIEQMKLSQEFLESELIQNKQSQKIKDLEQIRLEEKLQSKNRELTSTALHLMSKNELLNQIQEKIAQLNNESIDSPKKTYNEIKFSISDSLRLDEDWEVFNKHFTDVHPHFLEKLKLNYTDITTDELKLCAYLKIQLSSKEIARLINISVDAVNKRRNRLRKKLNISADEDFHGFFLKNELLR